MADRFIIYISNPPCLTTLTSSGKQSEWTNIKNNLEKLLDNYKKNDYANQEMQLFEIFLDTPFKEMKPNQFYKVVKKLMERIKDDIKETNIRPEGVCFNPANKEIFYLSYKNIFSLVNIIMYIIENTTSKGKLSEIVYDFAYKNDKIPTYKDNTISKQKISDIFKNLKSVNTIKMNLYKEKEDIYFNRKNSNNKNDKIINFRMDPKIVFFFSLFFKSLFKSITTANIDLNIPPIDNFFINNSNPYLINEEQILKLGDYYRDIIVCNLILIKTLPRFECLNSLNFQMYDSYQLELHNILSVLLDNENNIDLDNKQKTHGSKTVNLRRKSADIKIKKYSKKKDDIELNPFLYSPKFNNNYLYLQHILNASETKYFKLCLDFNSLDPLLFNYVNLLLTKFTCIAALDLILFPNKRLNKRKIYMNNCFYNKYTKNYEESSYLYSTEDKKIYYQYLDKNDNNSNNFILKDEKLLNELFYSFNKNLINLSIILEKRINSLLTLRIDFSTYNNESISLYNYDNYNCSIVCFIFDLFIAFKSQIKNCKIKKLEIFYDDFLDEKSYVVETLKIKIPSCKNGFNLNNLQLNEINFNISNISLILPFENFPSINLTQLILSNLSYNDLNNLVNAFKKDKNIFPVLVILDLSLGIMVEDYSKPLEILLKECLCFPPGLLHFNLNLPFNVSMSQLIDIIYWIKCNGNNDIRINIKMFHSQLSQCINHYYFGNCVTDLFKTSKDYFKKRNLLPTYEIDNENTIKFIINKYNKKNIDYFYKFIYCFQKTNTLNVNIPNQKIFENIFNFRGKFIKYEVNVEIIN